MKLCMSVCQSRNGVIGANGEQPWYVKGLEAIDTISEGFPVIIGRKSADSLMSPLSKRTNIVLTSNKSYKKNDFHIKHNPDDALQFAKSLGAKSCFILGGGTIFRQYLDYVDILYLTTLLEDFAGDTFFPPNFAEKFAKTSRVEYGSNINFTFETYKNYNIIN